MHSPRFLVLGAVAVLLVWAAGVVRSAEATPEDDASTEVELISVRKLWGEAPHSAFTTLIRYEDKWYCAFREARSHAVSPAAVRVITSADGLNWQSAALISETGYDLRDPHLSINPQGELVLLANRGIQPSDVASRVFQSVVRFSNNGGNWTSPIDIGDTTHWIWSVSWHDGVGYAIGYNYADRHNIRLYHSIDEGRTFQVLVEDMGDHTYPNETSIVFDDDGTAYCLVRRGAPACLGTSMPPYTDWAWADTGVGVGGPALTKLPDGRWLAAGRGSKGGARTMLWWVDPAKAKLTEALVLPSGGDTSYPGLVWHGGVLWVSYYASHEGKTSIYLAKVRVLHRK